MVMTMQREDHDLQHGVIASIIGLSEYDYMLAEAGILEPEKLVACLAARLDYFGYDQIAFTKDLEEKAELLIEHRRALQQPHRINP